MNERNLTCCGPGLIISYGLESWAADLQFSQYITIAMGMRRRSIFLRILLSATYKLGLPLFELGIGHKMACIVIHRDLALDLGDRARL